MQIAIYRSFIFRLRTARSVILLTCLLGTSSCSYLGRHLGEWCNTRAYVRTDLQSFMDQRFTPKSPVRTGVIPFVVPANLSARSAQQPGLGNELAWSLQRKLLETEVFPIIEVLNREDWPRKKEEFFTGNFGALAFARDAGYDLIVVGYLDPFDRLDTWNVHTKIIEVASGITIWYGTSKVYTSRADMWEVSSTAGLTDRRPDLFFTKPLLETVTQCIAYDMTHDPEVD